jgi:hypothetical protein
VCVCVCVCVCVRVCVCVQEQNRTHVHKTVCTVTCQTHGIAMWPRACACVQRPWHSSSLPPPASRLQRSRSLACSCARAFSCAGFGNRNSSVWSDGGERVGTLRSSMCSTSSAHLDHQAAHHTALTRARVRHHTCTRFAHRVQPEAARLRK